MAVLGRISACNGGWRRGGLGDRAVALILFAPAILLVLAVILYPAIYGVLTSTFETRYAHLVGFVGFAHYAELLRDTQALAALRTSLFFVGCSVVGAIAVGLGLALLLARRWPLRNLFRTVLLTPWVISQTVTALLWGWLLNPLYGPVTYLSQEAGLPGLDLLGQPGLALPSVIGINIWHIFPFAMVLLLAALQTIAAELTEAATIDGATKWQTFRFVTLPLLRRTMMMAAITLTIYSFSQVTLIYTLTGGGPLGDTETLAVLAFKRAFTNWEIGYAAAMSTVIFVLNVIFGAAYIRVLKTSAQ